MHKTLLLTAALGLSLAAAGCVVHEREVVTERPAAPPCHGAVWVEDGHHSHWDCPHEHETVEVQIKP